MLNEHILYRIRKLIGVAFTEKVGEAMWKRIKKTKNLAVSVTESGRRQGGPILFICLNKLGWLICDRANDGSDLDSADAGLLGRDAYRFYHIKNASQWPIVQAPSSSTSPPAYQIDEKNPGFHCYISALYLLPSPTHSVQRGIPTTDEHMFLASGNTIYILWINLYLSLMKIIPCRKNI
ncbi:hypothetical protein SO802_009448 [Lithocarpus litseifolius]|uniref:Uncharacterized protein n=1 Tax=Lithocarpus litseifolius TaxID=425828 RepID=A0AAW2DC23_9ROSI